MIHRKWAEYHQLRPDQISELVDQTPIAFWPLGLIEHHGWHLPVGYDGLKAERICVRIAQKTGGIILPVMWWGALGGHGDFLWTHYQNTESTAQILYTTTCQLIQFGFQVIVLLAGHYPWQQILDQELPKIQLDNPDILILSGTEMSICGEDIKLTGDHAGRAETSYGLALFPELIDLQELRSGRDLSVWPNSEMPPKEKWHPAVCFDQNDSLFGQMGQPADEASVDEGESEISALVDNLANKINAFLD